jgi:tetratricopeptide (TPR) repeat protein
VKSAPAPADVDRRFQKAIEHFQSNRLADAAAVLDELAPRCAERAEFFRLRGLIAMRRRDPEAALEALQRAARLAPEAAVHQVDLAEHYKMSGQLAESIRHYQQALRLEPRAAMARISLAGMLAVTGQVAAALNEIDQAVAGAGNNLTVLISAALAYRDLKQADAAIRNLRRALALRPDDLGIRALLRDLLTSQVRPWHFRMMNDAARNQAYDAAIRRAVGPDTHVLEIGTGSGLLAMMAARAGARLVTTCEQVEAIAETAAEIVRRNGHAERVHVVPKRSTQLVVGVDLPERADVLISEVLSDKLLGEQVLASTTHARQHLLKPDAAIIPREIAAVVRLVGGPFLQESVSVGTVDGFDLSLFNRFAPVSISLSMESGLIESLSDDVEVFRFDLRQEGHRPEERRLQIRARRDGAVVGVLQWLRLQLDDEISFENRPPEQVAPSAWRQVLYPFLTPLQVRAGETVQLWAKHDLMNLAFAPIEGSSQQSAVSSQQSATGNGGSHR